VCSGRRWFRFTLGLLFALPALTQVRADVAALASHPSLAVWRKAHPAARLDLAHYETDKDGYEVDYARQNRWCAAVIDRTQEGLTRAALFYVPSPAPSALQALPIREGAALTGDCELDALWYETQSENAGGNIVRDLSALWGKPNGASSEPDIQGWARWKAVVAWHRTNINTWTAHAPDAIHPGGYPRLIVYARRDLPRDWDVTDRWFGSVLEGQTLVADAVAQIAALDSALTAPVLSRSRCSAGPEPTRGEPVEPLAAWLRAAQKLTPVRRAAVLLLADFYITCAGTGSDSDPLQNRLKRLGAKYETRDPRDGPDYAHNFRQQAEKLNPHGPAGELAGLVSLADPCLLKGARSWPDLLIEKGTMMLNSFPATGWTPYVHFAVARAHATKLSFALPAGGPDGGNLVPLNPTAQQEERSAAISEFRSFLRQKPDVHESVFAWQEAWRLLADLPPSRIHFGCGIE
jgi:hypothetical protein